MADFEAGSTVAGFPIIHEGNVGTVIRTGNTPDSFITRSEADGRYPRIYFETTGVSAKDGDILTFDSPREVYIYNGGWRLVYPIDTETDITEINGIYSGSGNQLINANGFQRLPGGFCVVWGTYSWTNTSSSTITFSFTTSFSSCFGVQLNDKGSTVSSTTLSSFNNSSFTIITGATAGSGNTSSGNGIYYAYGYKS